MLSSREPWHESFEKSGVWLSRVSISTLHRVFCTNPWGLRCLLATHSVWGLQKKSLRRPHPRAHPKKMQLMGCWDMFFLHEDRPKKQCPWICPFVMAIFSAHIWIAKTRIPNLKLDEFGWIGSMFRRSIWVVRTKSESFACCLWCSTKKSEDETC